MTSNVSNPAPAKRSLPALVFVASLVLVYLHARHYLPFIADDSLISLRYVRRFLSGAGLTWTDGPRVEGYSNLLWILLVSGLGALRVDLIVAARILGVACTALALTVVCVSTSRRHPPVPAAVAVLFLAGAGPIAVWAIGGLEQPLVALLLALAIAFAMRMLDAPTPSRRDAIGAGLALGLLCLTRPDGPVFVAAVFAALGFTRRPTRGWWRAIAPVAALPAVFVVAQLAFRLAYYGEWLPNPAYIKAGLTTSRVDTGIVYVRYGFSSLHPTAFAASAGLALLLARPSSRRRGVLLTLALAAWVAYLVWIGGDIFPARRHFVPILIVLAFAVAEAGGVVWNVSRRRTARAALVAVLLAMVSVTFARQFDDGENRRAATERWEWDGEVVGRFLDAAFGAEAPLLACDSAGCLPYWSGLPALDMLGLNDRHIARTRPDTEHGGIAHQFGDGGYVLDREPDLVSFCNPDGMVAACFPGGTEMQKDPRFLKYYTTAWFRGDTPRAVDAVFWVRVTSDKVGIRKEGDRYTIPAYLFQPEQGRKVSHLDARGRVVLTLQAGDAVQIPFGMSLVPAATRIVASDPDGVAVAAEATERGTRLVLSCSGPGDIDVEKVIVDVVEER